MVHEKIISLYNSVSTHVLGLDEVSVNNALLLGRFLLHATERAYWCVHINVKPVPRVIHNKKYRDSLVYACFTYWLSGQ